MSRKKNILVTGGTGAIGSNLVKRLIELDEHDKLVVLDNNSSGHKDNLLKHDKLVFIEGDICADETLERAFAEDITHVYHLAANFANQSSVDFPVKDLMTNGVGKVKLLEKCAQQGVEKVVYASSSCVYKPISTPFTETGPVMLTTPYAITKLLSEHYVAFYNKFKGVPAVIVRYFSNYGPGDYPGKFRSVVTNFMDTALRGEPLTITGTGEESRPFTYVGDIVEGTIAAMEKGATKTFKNFYTHPAEDNGEPVYNISTPTTNTVKELAEKINELCGNAAGIVYMPRRDWDVAPHRIADVSKAKRELDFEARTSLDEGLRKTLDWFKSGDFNSRNVKR